MQKVRKVVVGFSSEAELGEMSRSQVLWLTKPECKRNERQASMETISELKKINTMGLR